MSYIDTFDHRYVGGFAGLPVYHPQTRVQDTGGGDFGCGPENLVLGGGGGEHPGLVFHRLDCLAMWFVLHSVTEMDEGNRAAIDQFGDVPVWDHLNVDYRDLFEFSGWSVKHFHAFFERCSSVALTRPFDSNSHLSFEEWLAISIGEFVWFSFPELITNLEAVRNMHPNLRPIASNVLIPPPGYPERFGRTTEGGQCKWGSHHFKHPKG